jgi:hypothetical protein
MPAAVIAKQVGNIVFKYRGRQYLESCTPPGDCEIRVRIEGAVTDDFWSGPEGDTIIGMYREVKDGPFPTGSGRWQVSTAGGTRPIWRKDGRELFFFGPDQPPSPAERAKLLLSSLGSLALRTEKCPRISFVSLSPCPERSSNEWGRAATNKYRPLIRVARTKPSN